MSDYIIAKLFGFMLGDGWISIPNSKYPNTLNCGFSGDTESLKNARADIKSIFKEIGKAKITTRQTCSKKYGIIGTSSYFIVSSYIAKHFCELGMPIGKKVEQEFLLPNWITDGDFEIKRGFISGLYCAEGLTPAMQKK